MHAVGTISVLHVVAGLAQHYGGPSYSVPRLCRAQAELGARTVLASVAGAEEPAGDVVQDGYRDIRTRWDCSAVPVLSRLRLSHGLKRILHECASEAQIVHNHGLWLAPNIAAATAARHARVPLVLSPRGMLNPNAMAFSRWQKAALWRVLQGPALRDLACVHATSEVEADDARAFGLTAPIAVVPNGVDVPDLECLGPKRTQGRQVVLYLGRLHPKKSLDTLVEAWAAVPVPIRSGWVLRMLGPAEGGYDRQLREQVLRNRLDNVRIEGPIYGEEKFIAFRAADLFVLPTLTENFGLTVAEALACGTPAISTRGAPWSGLETHQCGWWPEHGIRPLAAALQMAMTTPAEERQCMGERGRRWVAAEFSWSACSRQLMDVYAWLRFGGRAPSVIRF